MASAALTGHGPGIIEDNPRFRGALRGAQIIWAAPTFRQCGFGWREMQKMLAGCGSAAKWNKAEMWVGLPGGGRVTFRSMDTPKESEGDTADGIVVDEAPLCTAQAFEQTLRPMVSDTGGWMILAGTPAGMTWYWRNHCDAKNEEDSQSWNCPTLGAKITPEGLIRAPHPLENPEFSFRELQRLFRTMPERVFREHYLAEFVSDLGGVFRKVRGAVDGRVYQEGAIEGHSYIIGVDWARINDFTVFAVVDTTIGALVNVDRFNMVDQQLQIERLKGLYLRFPHATIVAEQNAIGMPAIDEANAAGVPVMPFQMQVGSKNHIMNALAAAFEQERIAILDDEAVINELIAYEQERLPNGLFRFSAPEGCHDDCCVALAIAWANAQTIPTFEFMAL